LACPSDETLEAVAGLPARQEERLHLGRVGDRESSSVSAFHLLLADRDARGRTPRGLLELAWVLVVIQLKRRPQEPYRLAAAPTSHVEEADEFGQMGGRWRTSAAKSPASTDPLRYSLPPTA
jgi:hypothetical protein